MIQETASTPLPVLLSARSVTVARDGVDLVHGVELALAAGELVWVSGPSGVGKSTLLRVLARLVPASNGTLEIEGVGAGSMPAHAWRAQVTLVPSPPSAVAPTVTEDLLAPFRLRVRRHVAAPTPADLEPALTGVGLGGFPLTRSTGELSQGQLARLALLRALLTQPRVLLLDEPTANLDPASAALVEEAVQAHTARGNAVLVAAHGAPWAWAARRYQIRGGRLEEE